MFKDEVFNNVVVTLSFADRLRVLLGRKIHVRVSTKTENLCGEVEGSSSVSVERIFPSKGQGGYAAI